VQVLVGKLGEDLQMDSWMLLFYNCCWSLPTSMLIMIPTGEISRLASYPYLTSGSFLACFLGKH
jgi:solute carrier family 35 protein